MKDIITPQEWIENWQSNRRLTRKVIETFPEKELFEFSVGGMRPFANLADELLYIADLAMKQFIENQIIEFSNYIGYAGKTKAEILANWDNTTALIEAFGKETPQERYREVFNLFGMFNYSVIDNLTYLVENEIHHRGQGYVYLRALNIEPPAFYSEF
ncbi:DinB family protein [Capnocytophaga catalasegens]|uniref:DNA damage-inducible protein DinB n=1 Tax=Capnocytophaga catalasegens TaxID=1004260 RepID=A0AAV5AXV4_9FLAO|nr:DinB family protein [Capnocytophaga catalasegens]GIZ16071.1 DNA damage-inducible protein DinB [Capnocytophaga catalasegens]GJM50230.1 DNA damage-inducible protein DinB [Capnocytophaga catalasegens]GJM53461.1 DNA damage-inducible protein DinB [Capnocytophaga catalasegens]